MGREVAEALRPDSLSMSPVRAEPMLEAACAPLLAGSLPKRPLSATGYSAALSVTGL